MSSDPSAASLDAICPTVSGRTMSRAKAGDLVLDAVDGCGGHENRLRFFLFEVEGATPYRWCASEYWAAMAVAGTPQ
jgi:hypothetical protein